MAKRQTTRAGDRWQPDLGVRSAKRRVGRPRPLRRRLPRLTARTGRLLAVLIVLAGITIGGWRLYDSTLLSISDVEIEGTNVVSQETVRQLADLEGQSLLNPDFDIARQRIAALPDVKDVNISRTWPTGVKITVVERQPWGVWRTGDGFVVIDDEGYILEQPAPANAPVIVQVDAAEPLVAGDRVDRGAVAVASQLLVMAEQTLARSVVGLEFSRESGLTAMLGDANGALVRATFGDHQGYDFKIATLYALLRQADDEGRALRKVDLRFGDRVAVRWGSPN